MNKKIERPRAETTLQNSRIPIKLKGQPLDLEGYEASELLTNKHFLDFEMQEFERVYLSESMRPFTDLGPIGTGSFIADDNRGAVSASPSLRLDGTDFYLSVKGVGSTINPFSQQPLGKAEICSLLKDTALRDKILNFEEKAPRYSP